MPLVEWYPPEYATMPVAYPTPIYPLAMQPVSPEEIATAATVGLAPRPKTTPTTTAMPTMTTTATPMTTSPTNLSSARSLIEWIQRLTATREPSPNETSARTVDPRLRGLAPLGSETALAIPAAQSHPGQADSTAYNEK
jgi:hypothetical protein